VGLARAPRAARALKRRGPCASAGRVVIDTAHPDDQAVLQAYATWQLLRRLRARAKQGAPTLHAADRARKVLAEAACFLHALREHDLDPGSCTQAELGDWLTTRPRAHRLLPVFLTWAKQHHQQAAALTAPATPTWQLGAVQPADQRWQLARRLLHDDTLPAPDRVTGLLVLPYGQLFPGRRPGRAAHPNTLGHRLRRLGIEPRTSRSSALLHLAEHLPARVLADLLGLHIVTAERWSTAAGTRWMDYAGDH